jgi:lysophospholipase L1-like esterase
MVRYLDLGPWFLLSPGHINHALYTSDQLHLNSAGYRTWADAMQALFQSMLSRPLANRLPRPV